jgi:hypothetical protein
VTQPAAGWYPDPGGSGGLRYWNGLSWTDHVTVDQPSPGVDPQPPSEPATIDTDSNNTDSNNTDSTDSDSISSDSRSAAPTRDREQWPPWTPVGADSEENSAEAADGRPDQVAESPGSQSPPPGEPGSVAGSHEGLPPAWGAAPGVPGMAVAPAGMYGAQVDPRIRFGPDGQVLAGWWRRFGGYMIDSIAIGFVTMVAVIIYGAVTGSFGQIIDDSAIQNLVDKFTENPAYQPSVEEYFGVLGPDFWPLVFFSVMVATLLSFVNGVVLVVRSGQTIGDRVVRTRKVVAGRFAPALPAAFLRWLIPGVLSAIQNIPIIGMAAFLAWLLDYLWPLWDNQRQTWHDKAAHTHVERADLAGPLVNRP